MRKPNAMGIRKVEEALRTLRGAGSLVALIAMLALDPVQAWAALGAGDVTLTPAAVATRKEPGLALPNPSSITVTVANSNASASLRVDSASLAFGVRGFVADGQYSVTTPTLPITI